MPLLSASNKVRVSRVEAHNDAEAQASLPPPGYASGSNNVIHFNEPRSDVASIRCVRACVRVIVSPTAYCLI